MTDTHPTSYKGVIPTPTWAFRQYERIRRWLPDGLPAEQQPRPQALDNLAPLADQFQVFVFDAFGVLNAGPRAFPGAIERFRALQRMGKQVQILSNAATASQPRLVDKYRRMGFDITPDQLISSRWLLEQSLNGRVREGNWGVIAPEQSEPGTLPIHWHPVRPPVNGQLKRELDAYDGLVMLSSEGWNEEMQSALEASLSERPRPLEIANPDLVAPRGDCLTLEPGFFAHQAREASGVMPEFYGKPYAPAFRAVLERFVEVPPEQILMVGDTLHTDILGGQNAGMKTLLVTAEGSLQGMDIPDCIAQSGIAPDFIAPEI
ncbi:HAD hydrolase-like protein [Marinobacter sp. 71-i]|uniref:HAD hydrolase-like protein n=1 Tax=Marinobacter iranensis TaxID=2962607 RepID=A0ABT5YCR4_9GAMM|nr:HAD hydrolase-like protein [Marinobacter iranensis]MDF0750805.1 HAD hydrolase-like protein [Marinobacter iranensis]